MSAIASLWLKKDKLEQMLEIINNSSANGIALDVMINDSGDNYGNNVVASLSQSKEDRDSKVPRTFVGNGKVRYVSNTGVKKLD